MNNISNTWVFLLLDPDKSQSLPINMGDLSAALSGIF